MTERTVAQESLAEVEGDDDDRSSLRSTTPEDAPEDDRYIVREILAEQVTDGKTLYLIEWEGYDRLESTWEPEDHIEEQATLDEWNLKKIMISRGLGTEFDVELFSAKVEARQAAKARRRAVRKVRRRKAGWQVSDSEYSAGESSSNGGLKLDFDTDANQANEALLGDTRINTIGSKKKQLSKKQKTTSDTNRMGGFIDESDSECTTTRTKKRKRLSDARSDNSSRHENEVKSRRTNKRLKGTDAVQENPSVKRANSSTRSAQMPSPSSRKIVTSLAKLSTQKEPTDRDMDKQARSRKASSAKVPLTRIKNGLEMRGAAATRGGLGSSPRGSGSIGGFGPIHLPKISKRRNVKSALMENGSRNSKHYTKTSILRKVELAGRNLNDRESAQAHDTSSLQAPSDYERRHVPGRRVSIEQDDLVSEDQLPSGASAQHRAVRFLEGHTVYSKEVEHTMTNSSNLKANSWSPSDQLQLESQGEEYTGFKVHTHSSQITSNAPATLYGPFAPTASREQNSPRRNFCRYFARPEGCKYGSTCRYLHHETPRNYGGPSDAPGLNPNVTCFSWALNHHGCHKIDGECMFAHAWTEVVGPNPLQGAKKEAYDQLRDNLNEWLQRGGPSTSEPVPSSYYLGNKSTEPQEFRKDADHRVRHSYPESQDRGVCPDGNSNVTCYYWAMSNTFCKNLFGTCKFAHAWTSSIATAPTVQESRESNLEEWRLLNRWLAAHPCQKPSDDVTWIVLPPTSGGVIESLPGGNKNVTCYFWGSEVLRNCKYSDDECKYAHFRTGLIARPPRMGGGHEPDTHWIELQEHRRAAEMGIDTQIQTLPEVDVLDVDMTDSEPVTLEMDGLSTLSVNGNSMDMVDATPKPSCNTKAGAPAQEPPSEKDARELRLLVSIGKNSSDYTQFTFQGTSQLMNQPWMDSLSRLDVLRFDSICSAHDFLTQRVSENYETLGNGAILVDDAAAIRISHVAMYLRVHASAVSFSNSELSMITYPTKTDEWQGLEASSVDEALSPLRYHIFRLRGQSQRVVTPSSPSFLGIETIQQPYLSTLFSSISNITLERLMPNPSANIFLLAPSGRAGKSMELISHWIQSLQPKTKAFSSQTEGSWLAFLRESPAVGGCILLHSSMIPLIHRIPYLRRALYFRGFVNVWSIGDGASLTSLYQPYSSDKVCVLGSLQFTRLFATGTAILLTPSFVATEPQKLHQLLTWFAMKKPATLYKLVVGNGFREQLFDIARDALLQREEYVKKLSPEFGNDSEKMLEGLGLSETICNTRYNSFELVDRLLSTDKPLPLIGLSHEKYTESNSPILLIDTTVSNMDEESLVSSFAGWTMLRYTSHRKFVVIGTDEHSTQPAKLVVAGSKPNAERGVRREESGEKYTHGCTFTEEKNRTIDLMDKSKVSGPLVHQSKHTFVPTEESDVRRYISQPSGSADSLSMANMERSDLPTPTGPRKDTSGEREPSTSRFHVSRNISDSLEPDTVYIASRDIEMMGMRLNLRLGDHVKVLKYVSGVTYNAQNLRTKMKGQVNKHNLTAKVVHDEHYKDLRSPRGRSPSLRLVDHPSASQKNPVLQFTSITGASDTLARVYLEQASNDIQQAVRLYLSTEVPNTATVSRSCAVSSIWDSKGETREATNLYSVKEPISAPTRSTHQTKVGSDEEDVENPGALRCQEGPEEGIPESNNVERAMMSNGTPDTNIEQFVIHSSSGEVPPVDTSIATMLPIGMSPLSSRPAISRNNSYMVKSPVSLSGGGSTTRRETTKKTLKEGEPMWEPTTVWYARAMAEGRSWEHIEVLGWEKSFERLGISKTVKKK